MLLVCFRKIAEQRGPRAATSSLLPQADLSGGYTIRDTCGTSMEKEGDRVSKQRWRGSERVIGRASQTVVESGRGRERERETKRDSGVEKDETRGREREREADIGYFYGKLLARRVNICMVVWASAFSPSFSFPPPHLFRSLSILPISTTRCPLSRKFVIPWRGTRTRRIPRYFFFFLPPIHPRTFTSFNR